MPHDAPDPTAIPESVGIEDPPRTLGATFRRLGPGMIIAGSIVGSGELIATTKVGAEAGFWLLWLILVGCVIKVFTQIEFGRYTVTWNETPLKALDRVPGPRYKVNWVLWFWALMTVLIITQQGGIVGGVGQAISIAQPLTEEGMAYNQLQDDFVTAKVNLAVTQLQSPNSSEIPAMQQNVDALAAQIAATPEANDAYIWAFLITLVTSTLLYLGRYGFIQSLATILVGSFTVITLITLAMLQTTDWAVQGHEIATGLSFSLPPVIEGLTTNPMATAFGAFGIIGLGSAELIMYPYWCLEEGYARFTGIRHAGADWVARAKGWIRVLHIDAWVSMVVYTFSTIAFFLLGAAVLNRSGLNPAGPDMVRTLAEMYVPVFGSWGYTVFLFGAVAVLYSTFFVAAAGNARIIADAFGLFGLSDNTEATRMKLTRILSAVWPWVAFLSYVFVKAPVLMIIAGGIAQALMLPILGVAALYFRYKRSDERLGSTRFWTVLLWISFVGFLIAGGWSIYSTVFG